MDRLLLRGIAGVRSVSCRSGVLGSMGQHMGKTEAVLAECVHQWRLMGEDQYRNGGRQEQGLGLEEQERRMQIQCTAQPAVLLDSGREQRCNKGSDFTGELSVFSSQTRQEIF